jgi:signal transduction histidine kinase
MRIAEALGPDMPVVTLLLHLVMVSFLVLAAQHRTAGFATASLSTLTLHAILKRLNDTRILSERRHEELVAMQGELDRRQHLATIGQTAATVFHQVGRHHGAIGMYAHLLGRSVPAERHVVRAHAARILTSVEEANRVIEELLRFGQDRALNLYPHALEALLAECLAECAPRADARGLELALRATPDVVITLDKHKVKRALGNLLDNAVDASAPGLVRRRRGDDGRQSRTDHVRDRGPACRPPSATACSRRSPPRSTASVSASRSRAAWCRPTAVARWRPPTRARCSSSCCRPPRLALLAS